VVNKKDGEYAIFEGVFEQEWGSLFVFNTIGEVFVELAQFKISAEE